MTSLPPPVPSVQTLGGARPIGIWRGLAVGAPHLGAVTVMFLTEPDFGQRLFFGLAWGLLNALWLVVLRRPALSGALSFALLTVLVLLSRLKHDIMQMTVNFVDVMVIDRDTIAFLFTIMPKLGWPVLAACIAAVPVGIALWRYDPFRV
ncbi:MAG: LTA synthase family protein, partial [Pseudomonadota bacterium]